MNIIPLSNLAISFIPVILVIVIMFHWSLKITDSIIAMARMVIQLLAIGYALNWIFAVETPLIILLLLTFMLIVASSIALRPISDKNTSTFFQTFIAITLGSGLTLAFIILFVLETNPWYKADTIIPLAGMIFASAMNTVSITAERFSTELSHSASVIKAREQAFKAGLIPLFNTLLAVGLVTLPGMMTGQIFSGVSPLVAVRYQIVVMCMITGGAGISSAIFLLLACKQYLAKNDN
ncbi:ABC transporter permease [Litorilituus lipolyticus]|uniref:ABC transporter permease n=1 Tax=Litorilituus lipolyticus TaxID=2491017 RepID=A0A502L6C9_9GAMM|nr:ABC transporter permease [Litorilituus lipolyticus]TPH18479.1 ABC transporter permease [Litorilituus lipolyticus]